MFLLKTHGLPETKDWTYHMKIRSSSISITIISLLLLWSCQPAGQTTAPEAAEGFSIQ